MSSMVWYGQFSILYFGMDWCGMVLCGYGRSSMIYFGVEWFSMVYFGMSGIL